MADRPCIGLSLQLIETFEKHYGDKRSAIGQHISKVKEILEDGVKSGAFRATPITTRMKEYHSALNGLQRRQKIRNEREGLKKRMESHKRDWDEYWTEWTEQEQARSWGSARGIDSMIKLRKEDQIQNLGPFADLDSMVDALQDFGGARVCVYSPHDVDKVLSFLEGHNDIEVLWVTRKTQRTTDTDELRSYVNVLDPQPSAGRPDLQPSTSSSDLRTFAGYRATHAVAKLIGTAVPKGHENMHYKVEIQITTVVMHAWSQVEHGISYKPGQSGPSDEEREILDLLNGIVLSGEAALKQLAVYTNRQESSRARDDNAEATSHYELGAWLASYCERNKSSLNGRAIPLAWNYVDTTFELLRSRGDHTPREINKLLDEVYKSQELRVNAFDNNLPLYLLKAKADSELIPGKTIPSPADSLADEVQKYRIRAKHYAFRVVSSINMASYLGVEDLFIKSIDGILPELNKRPAMVDFLDLLHSQHPQIKKTSQDNVMNFCQSFLDVDRLRNTITDRKVLLQMELPIQLTSLGFIASPTSATKRPQDECSTVVPWVLFSMLNNETPPDAHFVEVPEYVMNYVSNVMKDSFPREIATGNDVTGEIPPQLEKMAEDMADIYYQVVVELKQKKTKDRMDNIWYFEPEMSETSNWRCFCQDPSWDVNTIDLVKAISIAEVTDICQQNRTKHTIEFVNSVTSMGLLGMIPHVRPRDEQAVAAEPVVAAPMGMRILGWLRRSLKWDMVRVVSI